MPVVLDALDGCVDGRIDALGERLDARLDTVAAVGLLFAALR